MINKHYNTHILHEVLRNLGCFTRAGFPFNDQDLMIPDSSQEIFSVGKYRQTSSNLLNGLLLFLSMRKLRFGILKSNNKGVIQSGVDIKCLYIKKI